MEQAPTLREKMIRNREINARLRKKWAWSPWRLIPPVAISYLIAGTYLWSIQTPDPWLRAVSPVSTVLVFLIVPPIIQRRWFKHTRIKMLEETKGQPSAGQTESSGNTRTP